MNILYIVPRFPYPADQGDKVVIYNHIKFLSKRHHKIVLLSLIHDEKERQDITQLSDYCSNIEVFRKRPNLSISNFILRIFKREPFTAIRYYSPKMFRRSKELIESGRFDIVHTAFYYMGQYVINKKTVIPKDTAVILDTHNVEYLIYSRYSRLVGNPLMKLATKLESLRIKEYELRLYEKFDTCIAFSELDKTNMVQLSGASNIEINPACIELPLAQSAREEKNTILFFGLLNTFANSDAVRFFYDKIFPLIRIKVPDVKFIIAGKNPTRYISGLGRDPNVKLMGFVPDIRGLLKRVALVVVPLRLGGGIRVKILEAWAAGKAVISTSIGTEGVEVKDSEDIIVADSPSDFADAVVRLLGDDLKRKEIGQAAFRKVCEHYNPERVIRNLEAIYQNAYDRHSNIKP